MVIGHYATALIPHQRQPHVPLWLFLVAANLPDFLWLLLAVLGVEAPRPGSVLEASFSNIAVQMPYSHDLVPILGQASAMALCAYGLTRRTAAAAWCAALVLVHEVCDLVAGFHHNLMGPGTPGIGLDLYGRAPELALVLEAALGASCVWWFLGARAAAGRPVPRATGRALYLVFVLGALVWLPIARTPLAALLGLHSG